MGFYQEHCIYLPAMAGWFLFSLCLTAYNKTVFGDKQMKFPCPLLMTSVHFLMQWIFSWSVTSIWKESLGGDRVERMPWKQFVWISATCGIVTSLDVALSNLSQVGLSITFYTMIKSSTPIFVLFWAQIFGIERITLPLVGIILVISSGEFLMVMGGGEFEVKFFLECLAAAMLSGMRWTWVQRSIQGLDPPMKTMIATMRVLSPSMFLSLFPLAIIIDRPWDKIGEGAFDDAEELTKSFLLGMLGGFLAIAMILCEFHLIMKANAIILMVGGVVKEVLAIFVGIIFFHDKLNEINIGGIFVVFIGVGLFKAQFQLAKKQKQMEQAKGTYTPVKESLSDYDETESYEDLQDPGMTMDDDDDDHNDDDHLYNIDGNEDSNFKYDDYDGNEEYDLGLEFAPYPTSIKDENGEELRVV